MPQKKNVISTDSVVVCIGTKRIVSFTGIYNCDKVFFFLCVIWFISPFIWRMHSVENCPFFQRSPIILLFDCCLLVSWSISRYIQLILLKFSWYTADNYKSIFGQFSVDIYFKHLWYPADILNVPICGVHIFIQMLFHGNKRSDL